MTNTCKASECNLEAMQKSSLIVAAYREAHQNADFSSLPMKRAIEARLHDNLVNIDAGNTEYLKAYLPYVPSVANTPKAPVKPRDYYTLITRQSLTDNWCIEFGDYSRAVVAQERIDYMLSNNANGRRMMHLVKIIKTTDEQADIDEAVRVYNIKF